jgi:hypothetical protein
VCARASSELHGNNVTIGEHPVAVVCHAFWQSKLGGSPDVLGRTITLNTAAFTIVGVVPPGFNGLWLESPVRLTLDPLTQGYSNLRGQIAAPLYTLAGMVALVLLIACANSANLILSRGASRKREIAVRLSIGASRARVIRKLLAESLLLVAIAAAAGLTAANLGSSLLLRSALGISAGASPITASPGLACIGLYAWRIHPHGRGTALLLQ